MGKIKGNALRVGGLILSLAGAAIKAYFDKQERSKLIKKEVEEVLKNQKPNI